MRSHLHWAVAHVRHFKLYLFAASIEREFLIRHQRFPRRGAGRVVRRPRLSHPHQPRSIERQLGVAAHPADRLMDRYQLGAVGKRALHLHLVYHLRHPWQHIFNPEQLLALIHQDWSRASADR